MHALTSRTRYGRVPAAVLLAGLLFLALGCGGPDYKARGAVKGKVTVGKKTLQSGTVTFTNPEGVTASATLSPQGEYNMPDAPVGDCVVTVTVSAVPNDPSVKNRIGEKGKGPKMPGAGMKSPEGEQFGPTDLPSGPAVPKEVIPVDAKYSKGDTSGLKFKVEKGGNQTYNIEL